MNQKSKFVNFAAGWLKNKNNKEYISIAANGERNKVKVRLELEDGTVVEPKSIFINFVDEKSSEKAPDVSVSALID